LATNNDNGSFFAELKRRNIYRVGVAYAVVTWLLLQVLDIVAPIIVLPDWVPKLVLTLMVIGFPVAMLFAWAYEITPEGIKREKDVDRSQSITGHTGRRLDRITIGVLIAVVALLLVDKFLLTEGEVASQLAARQAEPAQNTGSAQDAGSSQDTGPSIAVLPFVNMSAEASSAYFSDGLADTVLHMLAQVHQIRVAARTSSFQFRDQAMDIAEIGRQLNVGSVLEGSVQRAGNKIRITAQLIDVSNGFHLWSGNFDRNLDDVFAVQDEIANEVVSALKVSLLGTPDLDLGNDQTDNLDAYTEYLLAISDLDKPDSESLAKSVVHLQEAIRLDPNYARAWSTLARAYLALGGYGTMRFKEAHAAARDAAGRALELAPDSSEALAVLGIADLREGNLRNAGELLSKAIETGPNDAFAAATYAEYLANRPRPEETVAAFKRTLRLDPLLEDALIGLAVEYIRISDFAAAHETLARLRSMNPRSPNAAAFDAMTYRSEGNYADAKKYLEQAHEFDPGDPEPAAMLGQLYLGIDMPGEAWQWFGRAAEINANHPAARSGPLFLDYYLQQNSEESFRLATELLRDDIDDRRNARLIALAVLVQYAERTGRYDAALEVLDNLYPNLFDDPPHELDKDFWGTYFVGRTLLKSGDTERGSFLLRDCIAQQDEFDVAYDFAHRVSVEARLLLGDTAGALQKLDQLSTGRYGNLDRLFLRNDPVFDSIREQPQFAATMKSWDATAELQRQSVLAMNDAR